jgi:3-oxoacyl-[acyl-carrier-protein] synthase II
MTMFFISLSLFLVAQRIEGFNPNRQHHIRSCGLSMSQKHEKIVITGLGVVSSVGNKHEQFFSNLLTGVSGISKVDRFDASPFKCQIAGQINGFDPKAYYQSKKKIKQNDLSCHYAVAASYEALADASLKIDAINGADPNRVGVVLGSAFGGMDSFEKAASDLSRYGPAAVGPYTIPMILGNTAAGIVAMETGAKGPNFGVQTACATATHALGEVTTYSNTRALILSL